MTQSQIDLDLQPGRAYLLPNDETADSVIDQFPVVDRLIFDCRTGDVKSLRALINQASQTAVGGARLIYLQDAHALSEVMQNTLLKILEEPSASTVIILRTNQPGRLLPTVLSRLSLLKRSANATVESRESVFNQPDPAIFTALTGIDRSELVDLLSHELTLTTAQLLQNPTVYNCRRVEVIDLAIRKLNQNTNQKLTIDWLLLHLQENKGK